MHALGSHSGLHPSFRPPSLWPCGRDWVLWPGLLVVQSLDSALAWQVSNVIPWPVGMRFVLLCLTGSVSLNTYKNFEN